jgi:hypothetical protein
VDSGVVNGEELQVARVVGEDEPAAQSDRCRGHLEVARKCVTFELVLDGACYEAAQASVADVHLDASGEFFLHADGLLADNQVLILRK